MDFVDENLANELRIALHEETLMIAKHYLIRDSKTKTSCAAGSFTCHNIDKESSIGHRKFTSRTFSFPFAKIRVT
ncbi:hypothetical protein QE152_g27132 [Popillia japonica]|uniref:Uncharacterized protein n=1 Tax=Popillia japonica TaxID=7064 RepID=A0AAW1JX85_POPJA